MRDEARIQAAIEITNDLFAFQQPADNTINVYFRTHRYIGSKDRRYITELVWYTMRRFGRFSSLTQEKMTGRLAVMTSLFYKGQDPAVLFTAEQYAPAVLDPAEKEFLATLPAGEPDSVLECPDWLKDKIGENEIVAMTAEATLDLRVNTLKADRQQVLDLLKAEGVEAQATPLSGIGIRINGRTNISALPLFADGLVEIQDEGSQLVSLLTQAAPEQTVIDWCAGAGGKTLALSAMMQAKGTVYAADAFVQRLRDLPDRACRAGAKNVILLNDYKSLKQNFDLVLIDAPCTGTGTWRRAPDARWRITPEQSTSIIKTQAEILNKACCFVKKGGRLFYITCSLDRAENEDQAELFLKTHPDFELEDLSPVFNRLTGQKVTGKTVRLLPSVHHTDGFFAASFLKK